MLESLLPPDLFAAVRNPLPSPTALDEAYTQLATMLEILVPFVPLTARNAARTLDMTAMLPAQYLEGSLLCADLSGFTMLAAELAKTGRQGSEEVSAIINQVFTQLLNAVYRYGGEVVKFAGDAVTAFFAAERVGKNHADLAATATLMMQSAMRDFASLATSRGNFPLRLRITVHSGLVFMAEVGNENHRELIVTGRAVHQVMVAQRYTGPAQIVITPAARAQLSSAKTEPLVPDLYLLHDLAEQPAGLATSAADPPAVAPSLALLLELAARIVALRPYVPAGLSQRLAQMTHTTGEFRPVTVIFAGMAAFTNALALLDVTDVSEREIAIVQQVLNSCYTRAQTVLGYFGGSINKVDMAISGDRLMGLFGAPVAHEDDPIRAVKAALELRTALYEIDCDTTTLLQTWRSIHSQRTAQTPRTSQPLIGIANGTVFAGIVGSAERHEYTVMGETVNLAARLFEAARPGHLLLPALTYQEVRHLVDAEPLPELNLKGFTKAVAAFQIQQLRIETGHTPDTPFVGRTQELAQISGRIEDVLQSGQHAGQIVALVGEAGIGKTRLAEEIVNMLQPATLIRVLCQSYEQTTPYATAGQIVRDLLQLSSGDKRELQVASVERRLAELVPAWSRFAPLLGPVLSLPFAETPLTRSLAPAQRRERTDDVLVSVILAAARTQPTLLLIDTLQLIDASSHAILQQVTAELDQTPLVVLLTYRSTPTLAEPWAELSYCTTLQVPPLSRGESTELLAVLLGGTPPVELLPLIERTAGMPLYLEQTVRYLLETNAIQRTADGTLISTDPAAITSVPSQIEQLIMARLDQLDEETRTLVQVAAVIGQQFSEALLARVLGASELRQSRLYELVEARMLDYADETATAYRFRQALIRDVVYDSLLYARRQNLHYTVAGAIEEIYAADLAGQRVVLAQHYQRAAQPLPAFTNYVAAAKQAQERYANQEALTLYEQALLLAAQLEALQQLESRAAIDVYANSGDIMSFTGAYDRAREQYQHVFETIRDLTLAQLATLQRKIGSTYEQQGNWEQALTWFAAAEESVGAEMPDFEVMREYAQILSAIGWVQFRQGNIETAEYQLGQGLDLIKPLGLDAEEASILNRLGGVAYTNGDMALARSYVTQSLAASERSGALMAQATALGNLGNLAASQGLTDDSIGYYQHAMSLHEQTGSRREMAIVANNLGWAFYDAERYTEALGELKRARELALELRDAYTHSIALSNLAIVMLAMDDLAAAEAYLEQGQILASETDTSSLTIENIITRAGIALRRGKLEQVQRLYDQVVLLIDDLASEEYGKLQRLEGQLLFAQGKLAEARAVLDQNHTFFMGLDKIAEARRTQTILNALAAAE
ncbi:MAG: tetratricopeptide repeat protein [Herpetosiphonaceae bacterium]|nr:tetratricopeptide repeat protein [Herpetosiphonaceae bacterium]